MSKEKSEFKYTIVTVPVTEIEMGGPLSTNYRRPRTAKEIEAFAGTLEVDGLQEPPWVLAPEEPGKPYPLIAGELRVLTYQHLKRSTIPVRVYERPKKDVAGYVAALRDAENVHQAVTFGDRVRSWRQQCAARAMGNATSDKDIARRWGVNPQYIKTIKKWDSLFTPIVTELRKNGESLGDMAWEDALTFPDAQAVAAAEDVRAAYIAFRKTGKLPAPTKTAAEKEKGGGRAAAKQKLIKELIEDHPWLAGFPFDIVSLGREADHKAFSEWAGVFGVHHKLESDE